MSQPVNPAIKITDHLDPHQRILARLGCECGAELGQVKLAWIDGKLTIVEIADYDGHDGHSYHSPNCPQYHEYSGRDD